jgi:hypothetical protein
MSGDVAYLDDSGREKAAKKYVNDAADLLEFRTRLTGDGRVHYRFTLTTMRESDVAAVALGIDTGGLARETDWGYGLGDLGAPVDTVLVTWGEGAELDGQRLADLPGASVDAAPAGSGIQRLRVRRQVAASATAVVTFASIQAATTMRRAATPRRAAASSASSRVSSASSVRRR